MKEGPSMFVGNHSGGMPILGRSLFTTKRDRHNKTFLNSEATSLFSKVGQLTSLRHT